MRLKLGKYKSKEGEAYAFLKFEEGIETNAIKDELAYIRRNAEKYGVSPEIEINVEETHPSDVHPDLDKYEVGNHIIRLILPGASNKAAADELRQIANYLHTGIEPSHIEVGHKERDKFHYEFDGTGKYRYLPKSDKRESQKSKNKNAPTGN